MTQTRRNSASNASTTILHGEQRAYSPAPLPATSAIDRPAGVKANAATLFPLAFHPRLRAPPSLGLAR